MKIISEILNRQFDTVEECVEAEKAYQLEQEAKAKAKAEKEAARKARAKEVEEAMEEVVKARKHYEDVLREFCKDYGSFHYTFDGKNDKLYDAFKMLNWF